MKQLVRIILMICIIPSITQAADNINKNAIRRDIDIMLSEGRKIIQEEIQFSEKEASSFWPMYDSYQHEIHKCLSNIISVLERINENREFMTETLSKRLIKDMLDIELEKVAIKKSYVNHFGQVLPPNKLLKLIMVETAIEMGLNLRFMIEAPLME